MKLEAIPHDIPPLETARLALRALALDDAEDMLAYTSDPEVAKYTLWSAHSTVEESRQFLAWVLSGSLACWAMVHTADRCVIGMCFLHSFHWQHKRVEIAFNLAQPYWGRGYTTEAARTVLCTGFQHYGLNRIEGTCLLDNRASARVLEKVGMRFEGILRQYVFAKNAFHDMRLYAILREDVPQLHSE